MGGQLSVRHWTEHWAYKSDGADTAPAPRKLTVCTRDNQTREEAAIAQ